LEFDTPPTLPYRAGQAAKREGRKEEKLEIARSFKNLVIPAQQIAQGTGLSHEEIAKL
jgi:predicted transposase YdaD